MLIGAVTRVMLGWMGYFVGCGKRERERDRERNAKEKTEETEKRAKEGVEES